MRENYPRRAKVRGATSTPLSVHALNHFVPHRLAQPHREVGFHRTNDTALGHRVDQRTSPMRNQRLHSRRLLVPSCRRDDIDILVMEDLFCMSRFNFQGSPLEQHSEESSRASR